MHNAHIGAGNFQLKFGLNTSGSDKIYSYINMLFIIKFSEIHRGYSAKKCVIRFSIFTSQVFS